MASRNNIAVPSLTLAMELVDRFDRETSSDGAGAAFFEALRPLGLKAFYARSYPSRATHVSTESLANQQHVYARISPPGWEDAYVRYRLDQANPIVRAVQTRASGFLWTDISKPDLKASWAGWRSLPDFKIENGIGVPCHGPGGYCAALSMGFETIDMSPRELRAIELASVALHDRMKALSPAPFEAFQPLSERERDALCFVADGKSDWEIGVILSISQATAHSHVENAKRKLNARTRAQAVARAARMGLI